MASKDDAPDYHRVDRRMIYLHRLAGDDVFANRDTSHRKQPLRHALMFSAYAIIAGVVVLERSQIKQLYNINDGIKSALKEPYFEYSPIRKKFDDIKGKGDVGKWLFAFFETLRQSGTSANPYSNTLSIASFNRVIPREGVCLEASSVTLTFRYVKLTKDYKKTTTSRFRSLFPKVWMTASIPPGASVGDAEDTEPIPVAGGIVWKHTPKCKTCKAHENSGYENAGGYIAVITTGANGSYVHFVDNTDSDGPGTNQTIHHCSHGLKRSGTLPLADFLAPDNFVLTRMASVTMEFQSYNANIQSLSKTHVFFEFLAAGALLTKQVRPRTLLLDSYHHWIGFLEYAYVFATIWYLGMELYKLFKLQSAALQDIWLYVNACSIVGSLSCFALLNTYIPDLKEFLKTSDFQKPEAYDRLNSTFQLYIIASSFAVFTILLRLLQFLASTKSRVMLLVRTIWFSARNILVYISYISIIFIGFATFALAHFSHVSKNFMLPFETFVSMFELFMGNLAVLDGFEAQLKVPFTWLFMFFFFFLSVQMFNAIINYSYNLNCEDMKGIFQAERNERQRQALQWKNQSRTAWLMRTLATILRRKSAQSEQDANQEGENDHSDVQTAVTVAPESGAPDMSNLDAAVRDKVNEYLERDQRKSAKDGIFTTVLYVVMVCCYVAFLYLNTLVEQKGLLRVALSDSIYTTTTQMQGQEERLTLNDVRTLDQAVSWLSEALPAIIFNSTSVANRELSIQEGIIPPDGVCIKTWNCLISGNSRFGGGSKLVRITQRRSRRVLNEGYKNEATVPNFRFTGGTYNGNVTNAQVLVNTSGFSAEINPYEGRTAAEDTDLEFKLAINRSSGLDEFCQSIEPGAGKGSFLGKGGIVCMLDADAATFAQQIYMMKNNSFFSVSSASFVVEFLTHNPNVGMVSHSLIAFEVAPSGQVAPSVFVKSTALFGLELGIDNAAPISNRLTPGIIYICCVAVFFFLSYRELRVEYDRRPAQDKRWLPTIYNFFTLDIFRIVDAISFAVSFYSIIIFIIWLSKDAELPRKLGSDFASLTDYVYDLVSQERHYNRMSSLNLLLVFVRPLRFIRDNPRIHMLNNTVYQSMTDVSWFIVVLAIVIFACTLLAHISFGASFTACNSLYSSFLYCYLYMLGKFDFWPLFEANPGMAVLFFCPYLILVYCVFTNVFFAILDRYFVSSEPPPVNLKRKLKPYLSKVCRCIDWDDDFVMEDDPKAKKQDGPKSRASRVEDCFMRIQTIKHGGGELDGGSREARTALLSEFCDVDERMNQVLRWGQEEAKSLVQEYRALLTLKKEAKNKDVFIKQVVMKRIEADQKKTRIDMEEAYRQMRHAAEVHELMALQDQQTLSKYILLLERQIQTKMAEKHGLVMEVQHLRGELDNMRYSKEDLRQGGNRGNDTFLDEEVNGQSSLAYEGGDLEQEEPLPDSSLHAGTVIAKDPNSAIEERNREVKRLNIEEIQGV